MVVEKKEQIKRLDFLLEELKNDSVEYADLEVGDSYREKRMAVRSLMNIRNPGPISQDFLNAQDLFLREEIMEKGIVKLEEIPTVKDEINSSHPFAQKLCIWQGDITRLAVGAIVNAANSRMLGCFVPCHRCIDNAIHSAAGVQLREECNHIMEGRRIKFGSHYEEPTGTATLTKGYNLPADYVIHTVGPIVSYQLTDSLREDLKNCYRNVLQCAAENGIRSVAFCCISTGEFHFPNDEAAEIAVETVTEVLKDKNEAFDKIIFNVFKDLDREIYVKILKI